MTRALLTLTASAFLLAGCESTTPENRVPTSLHLNPENVTLEQGDSIPVHVEVRDQFGTAFTEPPAGVTVQWTSSTQTVASVANGFIYAHNAGQTTISVNSAGLQSGTVAVTVAPRVMTGQMSLTYTGSTEGGSQFSGTYQIENGEFTSASWGITFHNPFETPPGQDIMAEILREDGRIDFLHIWTDGAAITGPGTRTVNGGILVTGIHPGSGAEEGDYDVQGTVQITSLQNRQMVGTLNLTGQAPEGPGTITVTGSFSLPVVGMRLLFGQPAGASGASLAEVVREGFGPRGFGRPR